MGLNFFLLSLTQRWSLFILHEPFQTKLVELLLTYKSVKEDTYTHALWTH